MEILCLTSRLPYPPDRGDRLRAFNFIKTLASEHELSLVSFIAHPSEQENIGPLGAFCRSVRLVRVSTQRSALTAALNLWRREPLQVLYYRSRAMQHLIAQVLSEQRFDVAYIHLFRMAAYLGGYPQLYRVVDLTDVISREVTRSLPYRTPFWRCVYSIEKPRIERYERHVAKTFEESWLISQADREALAPACPGANIRVVTNGVDRDRFYPTGQACEPNRLLFVGHMGVPHNVDAVSHLVRDVLPLIQQQIPACTVRIVGANPNDEVQSLAGDPAVEVTGFVQDLNSELNQAAIFVAPLRFAAGVQNKILEAMAAGRPVVTTSVVNEGLGARPEDEILVADDAEAMASLCVRLLKNRSLREQLGQAGLSYVGRNHNWANVLVRMREIEKIVSANRAQGTS
jgi:sugar transferase (PEP-CTERM/EpsH1 system associated)